jgi:hypothetical protein
MKKNKMKILHHFHRNWKYCIKPTIIDKGNVVIIRCIFFSLFLYREEENRDEM